MDLRNLKKIAFELYVVDTIIIVFALFLPGFLYLYISNLKLFMSLDFNQ